MKKLFWAVAALCPNLANASDAVVLGTGLTELHFEALPKPGPGAALIGGTPATPGEYPGVFYTSQGSSRCTGTVVGERVVASAAHCMSNGGRLSLTYKGETFSGVCEHAREYSGNSTADWALCLLDKAIPDAIAESVNTDGARLKVGGEIVLMGYGCVRNGGGGGNDGTLRIGKVPIRSLPSGTNYDIVTRGSSALCFGDSGGPSFFVDEDGKRWQTGINSRGNIADTSYLSSLHVSVVQTFYKDWAKRKGVTICGVHEDAAGCRE